MNVNYGDSAKKEHWKVGAKTACNRVISHGCNDTEDFKWTINRYPELVCSKCLDKFNQKYSHN